jgi:peptidase E
MSGGDVEEGMRILVERGMMDFLRDQYRRGKPFFGMSAGSIMLAKQWVRWVGPETDSSAELFPCLGLAQVNCDTHDEDDGWEELKVLTQMVPSGSVCYGIPSGAALVVGPDGSVRAVGGEVHCFARKDGEAARINNLNP